MTLEMTEDRLVQRTTAEHFEKLGWESVFAFNSETFGPEGTLGRGSKKEVVLTRYLRRALEKLNPGLPGEAYEAAVREIGRTRFSQTPLQGNREKYSLYKNGARVSFRNERGKVIRRKLRVFDFENPENNHFMAVRELSIQGRLYERRPDIVGFVNGIPLLFIELKNIHKNIRQAYDKNFLDYLDTIPELFVHNALVVLSNGGKAKVGAFSSKYEHFHEWKRLAEEEAGVVDLETLINGVCAKQGFLDLFENFILFDESAGMMVKIVARNHQYLGVNLAVEAVKTREEREGRLGVFWHTQGSGKSYSMVFFSRKVHRKLTGNFTFLIVTDREDLDNQIFKTFAGCGVVDNDRDQCRASSGVNLEKIMGSDKPYIFTMIHKFNKEVAPGKPYSRRSDIIVISDEAHRTQYGRLAMNMRSALPKANYIGFTGTPLFSDDEITRRIFGEYVSTYDFKRAVDDHATVPLFYDNRGEKLALTTTGINDKIAEVLEAFDSDVDQRARLEKEMGREYHVVTASKRLAAIAEDFTKHCSTRWESGKSMLVCIDKITAVRMYNLVKERWQVRIEEVEAALESAGDEQEAAWLNRRLQWLRETETAVVVSEEQGEVGRFREWDLDIIPHRKLIKEGFETQDGKRLDLDTAFKDPDHPFRIAIICAMWLTGFDVPSLSTLYLDKPLKAHTLMQAIARANRVYEGKNNGLIVDYCGILKNLRKALATFAIAGGDIIDPVHPKEELLKALAESIQLVKDFLRERGVSLGIVTETSGYERIAAITRVKEAINDNDESRKRFEIQARMVFKIYKACLTFKGVKAHQGDYAAID
ncbi:MAG: type I restriction endonuclease subunit R, partial [Desulfobacterales bacterium]|nr:type I restriction endonuclease subunit R [Desulfobacterales bacterium]